MGDDPLWYKDAIFYEVHVRAFCDSSGDGVGDFAGLTQKLDYLADLGVTAIWLLPFTPSPLKDDGYDIADYTDVHPRYGTLADVRHFLDEAHARGMRVITELVINHTSDQHPWFQRARRAPPGSVERNFYVWSDDPEKYAGVHLMFPEFESSNWSWDPIAKQYYWHRFYSHQPDLNFDNPAVRDALLPVVDFWFSLGVDGMRLDAVPYLFEREGTTCEHLPETHEFLKTLRRHVDARYANRMFLAEANAWPEDMVAYFGSGDECQMAFHFPLMPRLFMSLHQEDRFPIEDIFAQTPPLPDNCQWCLFLRNHDELTLAMVTDEERDSLYRAYTQDRQARLFLGIRHRLAPLLKNDRRRIELMNALLFSLPGTPVVYYGDEIGMGDNIYLGDRNGVRTPMQWSADRNAGFSRANAQKLYLPIITDSVYHYEAVNVDAQQNNPSSLLWWTKRLIALRKRHKAFGRGTMEFLDPDSSKVLCYVRRYEDECILVVANLSRFVQPVQLDLRAFAGLFPEELFGRTRFPMIGETPYQLTLGPHSFYWFALVPARVVARTDAAAVLPISDWREFSHGLGREALLTYLRDRHPGAQADIVDCQLLESVRIPLSDLDARLLMVRVDHSNGSSEVVYQPLALASAERFATDDRLANVAIIARTLGANAQVFCDPIVLPEYREAIVAAIASSRTLHLHGGAELVGVPFAPFDDVAQPAPGEVRATVFFGEQRQLTAVEGQRLLIRSFRRADEGVNPDVEVGRYLHERAKFDGFAPILGAIEYRRNSHEPTTVLALHRFVPNQGTAWQWLLDQTSRFFESVAAKSASGPTELPRSPGVGFAKGPDAADWEQLISPYVESARTLGTFTGQLHAALAAERNDLALAPIPNTPGYQRARYQTLRNYWGRVYELVSEVHTEWPEPVRDLAGRLAAQRPAMQAILRSVLSPSLASGWRIRCHGDYHLGQLLVTGRTLMLSDFEGDPSRPVSERRIKRYPVRDVASLIRSLDYVAGVIRLDLSDGPGRTPGVVREEDRAAVEPFANAWLDRMGFECWDAYRKAVDPARVLPDSDAACERLLSLALLERAMHEAENDLLRRPNWAVIPLSAILRLVEQTVGA
jgi:maltose alpha-D-glucosyltransferase/alpha-amylase